MRSLSFLPTYLFTQSFISMWTHRYLFYSLDYSQIPQLLFCSNFSSFAHWMAYEIGLHVLATSHRFSFLFCKYILFFRYHKMLPPSSSWIFLVPVLEETTLQGVQSYLLEIGTQKPNLGARLAHCLQALSRETPREMRV